METVISVILMPIFIFIFIAVVVFIRIKNNKEAEKQRKEREAKEKEHEKQISEIDAKMNEHRQMTQLRRYLDGPEWEERRAEAEQQGEKALQEFLRKTKEDRQRVNEWLENERREAQARAEKKQREQEEERKKQEAILEQQRKEEEAARKRKEEEEKEVLKTGTLWDGKEKPLAWFFTDNAKAVYEECVAHSEEMWDTLKEEGRSYLEYEKKEALRKEAIDGRKRTYVDPKEATPFDGMSYVYSETCEKLYKKIPWLIVFYNEFFKSKFRDMARGTAIQLRRHLIPLYWMMAVADIRCDDDETRPFLPYPDCLQEEKNPMLYYFSRAKKEVFTDVGEFSTIGARIAMSYIYNAFLKGEIDVSKEEWMYDKSFFFTALGGMKSKETIANKIKEVAKHPEYLPKYLGAQDSAGDL